MRPLFRPALVVLLLAALAGCDSGDAADRSIGGTYTAFVDGNALSDQIPSGVIVQLRANIPQTESGAFAFGGDVSATLGGGTLSYDFTGTGTYVHPDISMRIIATFPQSQIIDLTGVVSEDRNTLTLSDDDGRFATLRRRP